MQKPTRKPLPDHGDLSRRPGHLIRRAHQISVALFAELLSDEITPIQYALLRAVDRNVGIDQVTLARLVALDTSTTALTAARLESRGLLVREHAPHDRRQWQLSVSSAGRSVMEVLSAREPGLNAELLGVLGSEDGAHLMRLLRMFVEAHEARAEARGSVGAKPRRRVLPRSGRREST